MTEVVAALLGLFFIAVSAAVPIAIVLFINRRFKRSMRERLAQEQTPPPFSSPTAAGTSTKVLLGAALILAAFAVNSEVSLIHRLRASAFPWESPHRQRKKDTAITADAVSSGTCRSRPLLDPVPAFGPLWTLSP
jgi:hypothetical protein